MGSAARFYFPRALAVDGLGNVYVNELYYSTIRKITAGGVATTLGRAGTAGESLIPFGESTIPDFGVTVDTAGNLYLSYYNTIRKGVPSYAVAPIITTQPAIQSVVVGGTAIISVVATSNGAVTYQWRFNGNPLTDDAKYAGATTATLTVANLQTGDAGAYSVVATNGYGSTLSASAPLVFRGQGTTGLQFVAVGQGGTLLTSPDGLAWTSRTSGSVKRLRAATASANLFVVVGETGTVLTSPDGVAWATRNSGTTDTLRGVVAGPNRFVAVGGAAASLILYSSDGNSWSPAPTVPALGTLRGVAIGASGFVAVGKTGTILTSPDGLSWTTRVSGTSSRLDGVMWTGSQFVIITETGRALTSTDGIAWTSNSGGFSSWVEGLAWDSGKYIVVGASGQIASSPDGVLWTWSTTGTTNTIHGATWSGSANTPTTNPVALLDTIQSPTISAQSLNVAVVAGQNAVLSVTATGSGSLTYQWRRNGFIIPGANGPSYTIAGASQSDSDTYDVVIQDGLTAIVSAPARLGITPALYPQALKLDPAFDLPVESVAGGMIGVVVPYSATQFLVAGDFIRVNGSTSYRRLARFNSDGTLDTGFAVNFNYTVNSVLVQPDGKIVVGGSFTMVNGLARTGLVRLNANGTVDTTFTTGSGAYGVFAIVRQPADGKLIIGGSFTFYNGAAANRLARLNADGTLDSANFSVGATQGIADTPDPFDFIAVNALALDPVTGKVVVGGSFVAHANGTSVGRIARFNTNGTLDTSFATGTGFNGTVNALAFDATSKVLVGGVFTDYNGTAGVNRLARLTETGAVDSTFITGTGANSTVNAIAYDGANDRWLIGGSFTSYNGSATFNRLLRLNAAGALDTAFNPNVNSTVNSIFVQAADNAVVFGGSFGTVGGTGFTRLLGRVSAAGARDTAVMGNFRVPGSVSRILPLPGGKLLVAGFFTHLGNTATLNLARLKSDLSLDLAFSPAGGDGYTSAPTVALSGGGFTTPATAVAVINPSNGQITGFSVTAGGAGYTSAPTVTLSGGAGSGATAIATVSGGAVTAINLVSSASGPNGSVVTAAFQGDGRILIGGNFTSYNGATANRVARLNPDLSFDPSFNAFAGPNSTVNALAVIPGGGVYVGGNFSNVNNSGAPRAGVARLTNTGALDPDFNAGSSGFPVYALALQPDGKVLAGGLFTSVNGQARNNLVRFTAAGSFDDAIPAAGVDWIVRTITLIPDALQPNGKILVSGDFRTYNGATVRGLIRLNSDSTIDGTFAIGTSVGPAYSVVRQQDDRILLFGYLDTGVSATSTLARLNANGTFDLSATLANVDFRAISQPSSMHVLDDGTMLIGSGPMTLSGQERLGLSHLIPAVAPVIASVSASVVRPGASLTITGSEFVDVTAVRFNGVNGFAAPSYTVNSSTQITVTVPLGAVSGPVTVQSLYGAGTSASSLAVAPDFQVRNPPNTIAGLLGIARGAGVYVAVGQPGDILSSSDAITWTQRYHSGSTSTNPRAVVFAGGLFVAVGDSGLILTSPDGVAWTQRSAGVTANFTGVTNGVGKFVAVSTGTTVATSLDGINWSTNTGGGGSNAVAYAGGQFVAVGNSGAVRTSPDGVAWTSRTSGTSNALNGLAHDGIQYLAVGSSSTLVTSPDAVTWTVRTAPTGFTGLTYSAATYASGKFVVVNANGGGVITSVDGINWTGANNDGNSGGIDMRAVLHDGTQFVGAGFPGVVYTSLDGVAWTMRNEQTRSAFADIIYGNGRYVALGNSNSTFGTSVDGAAWTFGKIIPNSGTSFNDIAYGNGLFVAVGSAVIYSTADVVNWSNRTPGGSFTLNGVAYGGGAFVAVGNAGVAYRSTDGAIWASAATGVTANLIGIAYGAGSFVAVGASGTVLTSPDGSVWTPVSSGTASQLNGINYSGTQFVAVGASSTVLTSATGGAWIGQSLGATGVNLVDVAIGEGYYLATNSTNTTSLYASADGVVWARLDLTGHTLSQNSTSGIGFGNGRFVVGGTAGIIVSSNPFADTTVLTTQPVVSTAVAPSGTASLAVAASGSGLTYQWYAGRSGDISSPVAGATSASFTTPAVTQLSRFWARVTGANGTVDSATATVTSTSSAPVIALHPLDTSVTVGQPATFTVSATGTGTLTYQWRRRGFAIAGATGTGYTIATAAQSDADNYDVAVFDGFNTTASNPARLGVAPTAYPTALKLDPSFNLSVETDVGGTISAVAPYSATQYIVAGDFIRIGGNSSIRRVARINSADGSVDPTFAANVNGFVSAILVQPDGKVVLGGFNFTTVNGLARTNLVRLNSDGSVDVAFNVGGAGPNGTRSDVLAIARQPSDGKLIIGGGFTAYNGTTRNYVARLNADGTLDTTFNASITSATNNVVDAIVVQPDGNILIGGAFLTVNSVSSARVARLLGTTGAIDTTFAVGTGAGSTVNAVALEASGKVIIGGAFTTYNGTAINRLARLTATGGLDATFNAAPGTGYTSAPSVTISGGGGTGATATATVAGGVISGVTIGSGGSGYTTAPTVTFSGGGGTGAVAAATISGGAITAINLIGAGPSSTVTSMALDATGNLLIGGSFTSYNGITRNRLARLSTSGALDAAFNPNLNGTVNGLAVQSDGAVLFGGTFTTVGGQPVRLVSRVSSSGTYDAAINILFRAAGSVNRILPLSGGKLLIGGAFTHLGNTPTLNLARLNTDQSIDTTFAPAGGGGYTAAPTVTISGGGGTGATATASVNLSNGQVSAFTVTAGGSGYTSAPTVSIAGGGGTGASATATFSAGAVTSVSLNSSAAGPNASVTAAALQGDGKIVIGGAFTSYRGTTATRIARLNSDLTIDSSFNTTTGADNIVYALELISGGGLYIGGIFTSVNGVARAGVARLASNASVDTAFNAGSAAFTVYALGLQRDGKVVAGGSFTSVNGQARNNVVRFLPDGTFDSAFPVTGANSTVRAVAIQPDGQILIGGDFSSYNSTPINSLARLNFIDGSLDPAFPLGTSLASAVYSILRQEDAGVLVFGHVSTTVAGAPSTRYLGRVNPNGIVDPTLGVLTGTNLSPSQPSSLFVMDDGRVLIGTNFVTLSGQERTGLIRLIPAAPPVVIALSATAVRPGASITITGTDFVDVTAVRFSGPGGTAATTYTVNSPTQITVTVPIGAVTGPVTVQTMYGTASSAATLTVAPDFQLRNPFNTVAAFTGIAVGNGVYVAVGTPGDILSSTDGIAWTQRYNSGSGIATFRAVTFANDLFVAVGDSGLIMTSPDGVTWTQRVLFTGASFFGVTYGAGKFVAVSTSSTVATSVDGLTWNIFVSTGGGSSNAVSFGGGQFVAVGASGAIRTSPDAVTWTARTSGTTNALNGVTYGGSQYVAVGTTGTVLTSPDAVTWTIRSATGFTSTKFDAVVFAGGKYVVAGEGGVLTSTDGITWAGINNINGGIDMRAVLHDGAQYVGAGFSGIYTSPDAAAWTLRNQQSRVGLGDVVYGDGRFVAVGTGNSTFLTSADGVTWAVGQFVPGGGQAFNDVAYGAGAFVAVGSSTIYTSRDGAATWVNYGPPGSFTLNGVVCGGGVFVAIGNSGVIYRSTDAVNWTAATSGTTNNLLCLYYGAGNFVTVGANGTILTSPDGNTWTSVSSGTANQLNGIIFTGTQFVAVGASSTVLTSPTGAVWTTQSLGTTGVNLTDVAFGDGYYVATNSTLSGTLFVSTDAVTWGQAVLTNHLINQSTAAGVGFGNGRFVVVTHVGNLVSTNPASDTVVLTTQPIAAATVTPGQTVALSVDASGAGVTYQWYQGSSGDTSALIPGATNSSYTTPPIAQPTNFWARVTSGGVSVDSRTSRITGNIAGPVFAVQPVDVQVNVGQTATFTASATGSGGAVTYQWRRNGIALPGATTTSYSVVGASRIDMDYYDLVASDAFTSTASAAARLSVVPNAYPQGMRMDPAFAHFFERPLATLNKIVVQTDGKILVAGDFTGFAGAARTRLARFNADGTHDTTFTPPFVNIGVSTLAVQADGKVLVGGDFFNVGGNTQRNRLIRLNADGTLDSGFNTVGSGPNSTVTNIIVQPDAQILIAGSLSTYNGVAAAGIARLNVDGSLDPTFSATAQSVSDLALQTDGKIVIGGTFTSVSGINRVRIARLNANGTLDATFDPGTGANGTVSAVALDASGRVVIGGSFTNFNGGTINRIARLQPTGALDTTFVVGTAMNNTVSDIVVQSDGAVIAGGSFTSYNGATSNRLVRLTTAGAIDSTFAIGSAFTFTVNTLALQSDGQVIVGASSNTFNGVSRNSCMVRLSALGVVDTTLNPTSLRNGTVNAIIPLSGGKTFIAGEFSQIDGVARGYFAKLNADGTIDPSFNAGAGTNGAVTAAYLRADGKVIILGSFTTVNGAAATRIARLNSDGTLDPTFSSDGGIGSTLGYIVPQPDGRLLIGGNGVTSFTYAGVTRSSLARINADGTLDPTFVPPTFNGAVTWPAVQRDGKIVAVGAFTTVNGAAQVRVARLNADGTPDASFNATVGTGADQDLYSVSLQPDGRILIGGDMTVFNGVSRNRLLRLNPDGTLDTTISTGSSVGDDVRQILVQENGQLLLRGFFTTVGAANTVSLGRVAATGGVDSSFAAYGLAATPSQAGFNPLVLADDGTILTGGYLYVLVEGVERTGLLRLIPATAPAITTQPLAQTAAVGDSVTFSVTAGGSGPFTYQWTKNGVPISGATNTTLTLNNIQFGDLASYVVVVGNVVSSVASAGATLNGSTAPVITSPPATVTVTAGTPATLSVSATGAGLTYQWRRSGIPITGATSPSMSIPSTTRTDADAYDVVVANGSGFTTSLPAWINVAPTVYPQGLRLDGTYVPVIESTATSAVLINRVAPAPDGKFVAVGYFRSVDGHQVNRVARFTATGAIDSTFVPPNTGLGALLSVAVQSDGKVLIGGATGILGGVGSTNLGCLVRLQSNGTLDTGFNLGTGIQGGNVNAIVVQPDGKILIGGSFTTYKDDSTRARLIRLNADGSIDAAFAPIVGSTVSAIALQSDARILIGGSFTAVNNVVRTRLARLNADGSLDFGFDPGAGADNTVAAIGVAGDGSGRIVIGGSFLNYNGVAANQLVGLTSTGVRDVAFAVGTSASSTVSDIVAQPDGKFVVGGAFTSFNGTTANRIVRLTTAGAVDTSFTTGGTGLSSTVNSLLLQTDGSVVAGGAFTTINTLAHSPIVRFSGAGAVDPAVNPVVLANVSVSAMAPLPGGKILVGGSFTQANGVSKFNLARYNADGALDGGYNAAVTPETSILGTVSRILVRQDGKSVIVGTFTAVGGVTANRIARLNPDGTLDPAFNPNGAGLSASPTMVVAQPDGKLLVFGSITASTYNGVARSSLIRLDADGALDFAFNPILNSSVAAVALQPDGRIVIGGAFTVVNGVSQIRLARLNADGSLDTGFNALNGPSSAPTSLLLQPDGKVVVGGSFTTFNGLTKNRLARVNSNGALDMSFDAGTGPASTVSGMILQENGRIVLFGPFNSGFGLPARATMARVLPNGSVDPTFALYGSVGGSSVIPGSTVSAALIMDDGSMLVAGTNFTDGAIFRPSVARLVPAVAPTITLQPTDQIASLGGSATFTAAAAGSAPLAYLWLKNGTAMPGATNPTLTLTNLQLSDVAEYTLNVRNGAGFAETNAVVLTGGTVPTIVTQPQAATVLAGQGLNLSVNASGTGLTYQWSRNGVPIPGATVSTLSLGAVGFDAAGNYNVNVASGLALTSSDYVRVEVNAGTYPNSLRPLASFGTRVETAASVAVIAALGDGRFYAAGTFTSVDGTARYGVARFLANGALDTTWTPAPITGSTVTTMVAQPDGKIILGGAFLSVGGVSSSRIVRLNADGSMDSGFATGSGFSSTVNALALQADGKIVAGGAFTSINSFAAQRIARLNVDGTVDTSFNSILGFDGTVSAVALQADGKIVAGGSFTSYNGVIATRIARLNGDGTLDSGFVTGAGFDSTVSALAVQTDARIVVGGAFATYNGASSSRIARLHPSGVRDSSLPVGAGFNSTVSALAVQASDGKILAGGSFTTYNGVPANRLARLDAVGGALDASFNTTLGAGFNNTVSTVVVQAGGEVLAGGLFTLLNNLDRGGIARLQANGSIDASVVAACRAPGTVFATQPVAGGKLVVGGAFTHVDGVPLANLARFNADGSLDAVFHTALGIGFGGTVRALLNQADGKLLVGGSFTTVNGAAATRIARLNVDGGLDTAFTVATGLGFNSTVLALTPWADGKVLVGGSFTTLNGGSANFITRLAASGARDEFFNTYPGTGFNSTVNAIAVQFDGTTHKIVVGGTFTTFNDATLTNLVAGALARLDGDGKFDPSFALGTGFEIASLAPSVTALAIQPDNKIIAVGGFSSYNGSPEFNLARLNVNGTHDPSFATGDGADGTSVSAVTLQADGKIVVAGNFQNINGQRRGGLARLLATGELDLTFGIQFGGTTPASTINSVRALPDGTLLLGAGRLDFVDRITSGLSRLESNASILAIISQSFDGTFQAGSSRTLVVTATGIAPLSYQWRRSGVDITATAGRFDGTTTDTLSILSAQSADTGAYTVTVTDSTGTVTSKPWNVVVYDAIPVIGTQPNGTFGFVFQSGTVGSINVSAGGSAPLVAQWQKNGTDVPGGVGLSNAYSLPLLGAQVGDAGLFGVTLTNTFGVVAATPARFWVNEEAGWTWHNPLPTSQPLGILSVINGQFVATGQRGVRLASTDGSSWTALPVLSQNNAAGYAFGNGRHLLLGSQGFTAVSTDGVDWQRGNVGVFESTVDVTFGNGLFVAISTVGAAVSPGGKILTSADGKSWTERLNFAAGSLTSVKYGNGVFVVLTSTNEVLRSSDAITWSAPIGVPLQNAMLRFVNGQYFLGGTQGELYVSSDGVNWTPRFTSTSDSVRGLAFGAGQYILTGDNGLLLTSPDAVTWTSRASGTRLNLRDSAYANGTWVVISNQTTPPVILTSPDGVTWTNRMNTAVVADQTLNDFASDSSSLVAVGNLGVIARSTDGNSWAAIPSSTTNALLDVVFANGSYLAVGASGTMVSSSDGGITWSALASGTTTTLRFVNRLNGTFLALGDSGVLRSSPDGVVWSAVTSGTINGLFGAAYGGGNYVAVGSLGTILTSPDATIWTARTSGVVTSLNEVAFGNGVFVAVGATGTILSSPDGLTWTPRGFNGIETYQSVIFSGGRFYVGGGTETLYTSTDGVVWEGRHTGRSSGFNGLAEFNGRIFGLGTGGTIVSASLVPSIVQPPASQLAFIGQPATLRVVGAGSPVPVAYQWRKNGVAVPGATTATLTIASLQAEDTGPYDVVLTTAIGSTTSQVATLGSGAQPFFTSVPATTQVVQQGGSITLSVTATGTPAPTFQWQRNGANLPGATGSSLPIINAVQGNAGTYHVIATNAGGSIPSTPTALDVIDRSLLNLLSQVTVPAKGSVSVSFTIEGGPKNIFVRGVGPALTALPGLLADPRLTLVNSSLATIATNDDWGAPQTVAGGPTPASAGAITAASAAVTPSPGLIIGSKDAAILVALTPGTYTVVLDGVGGTGGLAQLEVIDADTGLWPRLAMFALRGPVTGDKNLNVGVNLSGTVRRKYLIRVLGQSLGVNANLDNGVLIDPVITFYKGASVIASNDDSESNSVLDAATVTAGAQPRVGISSEDSSTFDSTLFLELEPGSYTADIRSYYAPIESGDALFEIFAVDDLRPAAIAPAITYFSAHQQAVNNGDAVLAVVTVAKPAATFQWRRYVNGVPTAIPGATTSVLRLTGLLPSDSGSSFDVVISSGANTITSPSRTVTVLPDFHSADINRDQQISIYELLRVIQLRNYTTSASVITGEYHTESGTEDGFTVGPGALTSFHSADSNRDGRISANELTRVVVLYFADYLTNRPGRYHARVGTEDGFAPGPSPSPSLQP